MRIHSRLPYARIKHTYRGGGNDTTHESTQTVLGSRPGIAWCDTHNCQAMFNAHIRRSRLRNFWCSSSLRMK